MDFSLFKGNFKHSLHKINNSLDRKKKIFIVKRHKIKPLSKEFRVGNAEIKGGHKQLKKVIVERDRDLIVQGVDKFVLSKDNDINSYKNIGYYKGKRLKELIVMIENNTSSDFELEIFNPSMPLDFLHSTSADLNSRVSVGGAGTDVSYSDILFNMLANPTLIVNARLTAEGATNDLRQAQILQPLFFKNKSIEAVEKIQPMQLQNHKDLMQVATNIVCFDIICKLNRAFIPDGMDVISYKVLAGASANFCFYYEQHSLKKFFFKEARDSKTLI